MSELPPTPRGPFRVDLGNRYVMDYLRVMSGLGYNLLARRQLNAFAKAEMRIQEANELLDIMTRMAQKMAITQVAGGTHTPRPSREALMAAETIARRSNVMRGKPKLKVIDGDKR